LGRFLRGVAIPSDFGSIFKTAVDMEGLYTKSGGFRPPKSGGTQKRQAMPERRLPEPSEW